MTEKNLYIAVENISKNDVICFSDGLTYPLKTQQDFLRFSGPYENAGKAYKKGDQVEPTCIPLDLVASEVENIKKLSNILSKSTNAAQKIISSLIIKKLSALKVFNEKKDDSQSSRIKAS